MFAWEHYQSLLVDRPVAIEQQPAPSTTPHRRSGTRGMTNEAP